MKRLRQGLSMLLLTLLLVGSVLGCQTNENNEPRQIEDLENATIGLVTGTSWDLVVQKHFPNANRKYFASGADAILALKQGKIDSFVADRTVYAGMRWENSNLSFIDEPLSEISNALIFAKEGYDEELLREINEFVALTKSDGTLDALAEKWFGDSEPNEHPNYMNLTGTKRTLKVAVGDSMKPTAYQGGIQYTGYEVDFLTLFAKEYGYTLDLQGMTFEALIPSVASGKFDIGACGITITPERAESVTFADSHFETYGVAVIRNETNAAAPDSQKIQSLDDIKDHSLAILMGTVWDSTAQDRFPAADRKYFSSMTDMIVALDQGKVDALLGDRTFYVSTRWENIPVTVLDEAVGNIACGLMLKKSGYDPLLLQQLNDFIAEATAAGRIEALSEKWFSDTEPTEHPDYSSLSGKNGVMKIAVDNTARPMTYRKNEFFTGFDVELLTEFAKAYGYALEIEGMSFDALIPAVSSGRYDLAACGTAITPERAESVTFTDSYLSVDGVIIVSERKNSATEENFFERVATGFEKTFIRESRWKLILEGIGVTLLISISAAIAGTALGLGLYMLSRSDVRLIQSVSKAVAKVYSRIIAGTPVVVILMILFYVVFGSLRDMSGIVVAVIGFTLTFGAFVYNHMAVSVSSVDIGQTEAAYALGYTKNKTFFRIVLPQAMKIFLPSYCSQAVELVKATAVVGYIAVNDLTKMGDIIRSNTYEAFFPLIAVATIYFLLTWAISLLLGLVRTWFEPKQRSEDEILKGVKQA